jgi:predicted alpha-1,2-mannosidase
MTPWLVCVLATTVAAPPEAVDSINPMVGASTLAAQGEGKTFPGAATPFGLVQLSPDTITGGDNGPGYSYHHHTIEGFSFTHMSGVGWYGDLGNLQVMPTVGPLKTACGRDDHPGEGYRSRFSHDSEVAQAGYYAVTLADSGVRAELTAAPHAGMLRFTYPQAELARVQIDLARRVAGTSVRQHVKVVSDHAIEGWMLCTPEGGGWGNGGGQVHYRLHFALEFDRPLTEFGVWSAEIPDGWKRDNDAVMKPEYRAAVAAAKVTRGLREAEGKHLGFFVEFPAKGGEQVRVKAGISFVNIEGARANLAHDIPDWDFDRVRAAARALWAEALAGVKVEGGSDGQREAFFSALYHCHLDPRSVSDVDGQYIGADNQPHRASDFVYRSIFSGWDVFRSQYPLLTIIEPETVNDQINSQMQLATLSGHGTFERWEMLNAYSGCMIGQPMVSVLTDAWLKGIRRYDIAQAYAIAKATEAASASRDRFMPGSLSWTVENAYYDHCMALLAADLGHADEAAAYAGRALWYANVYDPSVGNLRARNADGSWMPWRGKTVEGQGCVESNPYQQGWFVPQDVQGLINLMGRRQFLASLSEFFEKTPLSFAWNEYYNHSNEPVHHVAYMFTYAGAPWLTQTWARTVMDHAYGPGVHGLCGNEDVGQMSAWYVLSAIGFHPMAPADGVYVIGSPLFDRVTLRLDPRYYPGREFTVIAHGPSEVNRYVQSATLNGRPLTRAWIRHAEIVAGGTLELVMGPQPNRAWGSAPADRPPSLSQPVVCEALAVTPLKVRLGEAVTASVTLVNEGQAPTHARALLWSDEQALANQEVILAAGERKVVPILLKLDHEGQTVLHSVDQPPVTVEVFDDRPPRLLAVEPRDGGLRLRLVLSKRLAPPLTAADCRIDDQAPTALDLAAGGTEATLTLAAPPAPGRHHLRLSGPATCEAPFTVANIKVEVFRTTGEWSELPTGAPSAADYADRHSGHGVTVRWVAPFTPPHPGAGADGLWLPRLIDGQAAANDDDPGRCVWFDGGEARLLMDLKAEIPLTRVLTFSRHRGDRAPQQFVLYGAGGGPEPDASTEPAPPWELVARVDSRALGEGGKHVSAVSGSPLGRYRYLLWVLQPVARQQNQGTFLTEVDVWD